MFSLIYQFDLTVWQAMFSFQNALVVLFFRYITFLGDKRLLIPLSIVVFMYFVWHAKKRHAAVFAFGLIGLQIVTQGLKLMIQRPRPLFALVSDTTFSFPSGHTSASVFFYGFLVYYIRRKLPAESPWRTPLVCVFAVLPLLIGVSRIYLGIHYISDVLAGALIGGIFLYFAVRALSTVQK